MNNLYIAIALTAINELTADLQQSLAEHHMLEEAGAFYGSIGADDDLACMVAELDELEAEWKHFCLLNTWPERVYHRLNKKVAAINARDFHENGGYFGEDENAIMMGEIARTVLGIKW